MNFENLLFSGKTYRNALMAVIIVGYLYTGNLYHVTSESPYSLFMFAVFSYAFVSFVSSVTHLIYTGITGHFERKAAITKWDARIARREAIRLSEAELPGPGSGHIDLHRTRTDLRDYIH